MFRPQMLAIFSLYKEKNLSNSYTCICRGCVGCRGGGISARSRDCGGVGALGLGWLGTIYRQSSMPTYNYVLNKVHNNIS